MNLMGQDEEGMTDCKEKEGIKNKDDNGLGVSEGGAG